LSSPPVQVSCLGFVFDPVAQEAIRRVAPAGLALTFSDKQRDIPDALLADCEVLMVVAPVTAEMIARAPRLRFIQKWGTGYDKIDLDAAARRGVPVAITAGANADTIGEHAVTLMLTVLRRVIVADRALREGRWIPNELRPVSRRLFGKTIGIVGMGNIGRAVARMLHGFNTELLYTKRGGRLADEAALGATFVSLPELLRRSDIVTLHCPGGAANRHMIDRAALAAMKPGAVLINVARGDLVDEAALIAALRSGHLSGAGLDVFAEEPLPAGSALRGFDNVVLTPHAAGSVADDIGRMARHAFENVEAFLRGEPIRPADLIVGPQHPAWGGAGADGVPPEPGGRA
jgi:D-3-phosphoglycerate dehydrogenase